MTPVFVKGFRLLPSTGACDLCLSIADEVGEIPLDGSFHHDDTAPEEYQDRFIPVHPACQCALEYVLDEGTTSDEG